MGCMSIMVMLTSAGVVDAGEALVSAAKGCHEAAVKFLLQQRQQKAPPTGLVRYVNVRDRSGCTALFRSINFRIKLGVVRGLASPRVVRLLVDAGADTTSALRLTDAPGGVNDHNTALAFTNKRLREKKVRGSHATEEQLYRLEAIRRLLLREEAAHAISWLWPRGILSAAKAVGDTKTTKTTNQCDSGQWHAAEVDAADPET